MTSIVGESHDHHERWHEVCLAVPASSTEACHSVVAVVSRQLRRLKAASALLLVVLASGCPRETPTTQETRTLTVAAAASLRPALEVLVKDFERQASGVDVVFVDGASGTLVSQSIAGAPFDLLIAADDVAPQQLVDAGVAEPESRFILAQGRLVLWIHRKWEDDFEQEDLQFLRSSKWQRIAWADPRIAPYGQAAEEILRSEGLLESIQPRALVGGSVSQVANWLATEAADVGMLPLSLALQEPLRSQGFFLDLTDRLDHPILHGGVILRRSRHHDLAHSWIEYLRSPTSRAILQEYGYQTDP